MHIFDLVGSNAKLTAVEKKQQQKQNSQIQTSGACILIWSCQHKPWPLIDKIMSVSDANQNATTFIPICWHEILMDTKQFYHLEKYLCPCGENFFYFHLNVPCHNHCCNKKLS